MDHLREHTQKMGRKESDLVMAGTNTVVKLETMNIPIKRKRHGSSGASNKRIKLLDGETELSVDPTVDKVLCKSCKPAKYFKNVDALRYHLVCSHDVPKSSSYYCDPSLSPRKLKPLTPVKTDARKLRVKSQPVISEIQDVVETQESPGGPAEPETPEDVSQVKGNSDSTLAGKFREALRVRRMNAKRSPANCRSTKPQPVCLSEKKPVSESSDVINESIKQELSDEPELEGETKDDVTSPSVTSSSKRQSKRLSQEPPKTEDETECAKLESREERSSKSPSKNKFLAPATVKKSGRSLKKTPEVKVAEKTGRRVSERRFEGKKPYKCNHCQLSYSSLENKKVHEQTHIEKNLICVFCDMRFYFPLCLKKHKRIHQK